VCLLFFGILIFVIYCVVVFYALILFVQF
jgi:hypothetical protein